MKPDLSTVLTKRHILPTHPYQDATGTAMRPNRQSPAGWRASPPACRHLGESAPLVPEFPAETQSPLRIPASADNGRVPVGWACVCCQRPDHRVHSSSIRGPLIVLRRNARVRDCDSQALRVCWTLTNKSYRARNLVCAANQGRRMLIVRGGVEGLRRRGVVAGTRMADRFGMANGRSHRAIGWSNGWVDGRWCVDIASLAYILERGQTPMSHDTINHTHPFVRQAPPRPPFSDPPFIDHPFFSWSRSSPWAQPWLTFPTLSTPSHWERLRRPLPL